MDNREQMLAAIVSEDSRVQYDGQDEAKIAAAAGQFTEAAMIMIEAMGRYRDAMNLEPSDDSADLMKAARYDLVYAWTTAQGAVSKIALTMRIDGDEAYRRAILGAEKADDDLDLSGL